MSVITLNINDIITEFGAYYIDGGQNIKDLYKRLFTPAETASFFKLMPVQDTVLRGASVEMAEVLQPYQDDFTPKGDPTFSPTTIPLFQQKIDWEKNPNAFVTTWLGFLATEENVDRTQWPFIKYLIQQLIIPRYYEDHELKAAYKGVQQDPTPGTPGAAEDSMNGIRFIINDHISSGKITPIPTGAFSSTPKDFVTQIEDWVELINELYRDSIDYIFMSKANETKYRKGKRTKYNEQYAQDADLLSVIDHPSVKIKGLRSMTGSDKIWATLNWNRLRPQKRVGGHPEGLKVEGSKRTVSIYTDWFEGLGFPFPQLVFTNDLDTGNGSSS